MFFLQGSYQNSSRSKCPQPTKRHLTIKPVANIILNGKKTVFPLDQKGCKKLLLHQIYLILYGSSGLVQCNLSQEEDIKGIKFKKLIVIPALFIDIPVYPKKSTKSIQFIRIYQHWGIQIHIKKPIVFLCIGDEICKKCLHNCTQKYNI